MQIFFVYDTDYCKTEKDDPKDAIIYFYPLQITELQRVLLCQQLMAVVQFFSSSFTSPRVVTLQRGKFVFKKCHNYFLVLGGSITLASYILKRQLNYLWEVFCFYYKSISLVRKSCGNRSSFLMKMAEIFHSCLIVSQCFGNTLHRVFDAVPLKNLPKECSDISLKSFQLLQSLQSYPGVIAGSIFCKNWLLSTQFSPELTSYFTMIKNIQETGIRRSDVKFKLPTGVELIEAYLPTSDLNTLKGVNYLSKHGKFHGPPFLKSQFQIDNTNNSDLSSGTQGDIDSDEPPESVSDHSLCSPIETITAKSTIFCRKSSGTSTSICTDLNTRDETDCCHQFAKNLKTPTPYLQNNISNNLLFTAHNDGNKCNCTILSSHSHFKYNGMANNCKLSNGLSHADIYRDLLECVSECLESCWKRCSSPRLVFSHCKCNLHLNSSRIGSPSCCKNILSHPLHLKAHSNSLKRWKSEANVNDNFNENIDFINIPPSSDITSGSSKSILEAIRNHLKNILPTKTAMVQKNETPVNYDQTDHDISHTVLHSSKSTNGGIHKTQLDTFTDKFKNNDISTIFRFENSDEYLNGSSSNCPSPAFEATENKIDSDDFTSEDENDVKEILLFVLHYNDSIMIILSDKSLKEKEDTINNIWKSSLSCLGDLVVDLKQRIETIQKKDDSSLHHFICYDKMNRTLTGNPCTLQPENKGHRNVQLLHEDFLKNPKLKSFSVVTPSKMIHSFNSSLCEAFYHHPPDGGYTAGIPNANEAFGNLSQKATVKLEKDTGMIFS